ncbi:MAG: nucleoside kinase [Ruminococcus sp.]|nr:nucleoside kinase [Ruminococcus sp.]
MRKAQITDINRQLKSDEKGFIKSCDKKYFSQVKAVCDAALKRGDSVPLILLLGPSGSGKTTTALKIEEYLDSKGLSTHTISMDDYFLPIDLSHKACDEKGKLDYESPDRLDIPLLNEQMHKIANCEEVELPEFDFKLQKRIKGSVLKRKHGEVVIFEGIHALNPEVTGASHDIANFVYVSVRTRIETQDGDYLHPSMIRLMRRIIRDRQFRGRNPVDTINAFDSVERGENRYIMPYKNIAEFNIDSFLGYELPLYKTMLLDRIQSIASEYKDINRFETLKTALEQLQGVDINSVPDNSLIREFVGGSCYKY